MKKNYSFFIKFGDKANMEKLLNEGEIYCKPIKYFEEVEQNTSMADVHEGADRIIQGKDFKLFLDENTLHADTAQLVLKKNELTGNLYCFYGFESKNLTRSSKERRLDLDTSGIDWGDTAIVILDTVEFMKRMNDKLNELKHVSKLSPVIYYDLDTFDGNLSIFHKRKFPYEKQSEIRYFIENTESTTIKFNIGSLSDIAALIPKDKPSEMTYMLD